MRHQTPIEIRFNDIDVMGHVNNAVYLTYFEQARMKFFEDSIGSKWNWKEAGILIGRVEIDYLSPVQLHDKVVIETYCNKIGNKSFELSYEIFKGNGEGRVCCVKSKSILVCFDYKKQQTIPVPVSWKEKLEQEME